MIKRCSARCCSNHEPCWNKFSDWGHGFVNNRLRAAFSERVAGRNHERLTSSSICVSWPAVESDWPAIQAIWKACVIACSAKAG